MQRIISDAEFTSAVKRLNDRIKQFNVQGLTESQQYQTLLGSERNIGGKTVKGVLTGLQAPKLRTSTVGGQTYSYPVLSTKRTNYTAQQIADIVRLGKKGGQTTAGGAVKQAKEGLKARGIKSPTREQIRQRVKADRDTHDFIINNANDIYLVQELASAVRRSTKLTPAEQDKLLSMYHNPDYRDDNGDFVGDNAGEYLREELPR